MWVAHCVSASHPLAKQVLKIERTKRLHKCTWWRNRFAAQSIRELLFISATTAVLSVTILRMTMRAVTVSAALLLGLTGIGCSGGGDAQTSSASEPPLFEQLSSDATGVDFENALSENPTPHRTELLYEYFSNGAGVAVGDVNGDGRPDLYFTGNMRYNALYLNEADMTFRDVTHTAGVEGRKNTWNTGVTMADVNGDGRLDLYVCY